MSLEDRHVETLRHVQAADQAWAESGNEQRTFLLIPLVGETRIEHPRWDANWPMPSTSTIDDLAEAGLLRVDGSGPSSKGRSFELTLAGRSALSGSGEEPKNPIGFS